MPARATPHRPDSPLLTARTGRAKQAQVCPFGSTRLPVRWHRSATERAFLYPEMPHRPLTQHMHLPTKRGKGKEEARTSVAHT